MRLFLLVLVITFVTNMAEAAGKSAKKMAADSGTPMTPPQVLEVDDNLVGLRAATGSPFGGAAATGFSYERMIKPNFGINGQVHYASYSTAVGGPFGGEFQYTAWALLAMGTFHFDIFKVRNLDTYVSAGFARSILSSKWTGSTAAQTSADASSTFLVAYLDVRYFLNSEWGLSAHVGTGLGPIGVGVDYLF